MSTKLTDPSACRGTAAQMEDWQKNSEDFTRIAEQMIFVHAGDDAPEASICKMQSGGGVARTVRTEYAGRFTDCTTGVDEPVYRAVIPADLMHSWSKDGETATFWIGRCWATREGRSFLNCTVREGSEDKDTISLLRGVVMVSLGQIRPGEMEELEGSVCWQGLCHCKIRPAFRSSGGTKKGRSDAAK